MIGWGEVVLLTDHESTEGSRRPLEKAVELLTGRPPLAVDARHFMTGGGGRVSIGRDGFGMVVPSEGVTVRPGVLIGYEIPPAKRHLLMDFLSRLPVSELRSLGLDPGAWRDATDKCRMVKCFQRDGIPHMETIVVSGPDPGTALEAFDRLGRDVWARPAVGAGGADVFHLTTVRQLRDAASYFAASGQDWMLSRDAGNVTGGGQRRQFRVVVLHDRVLRVCKHLQADPDAPCNESRGAVSTVLRVDDLPPRFRWLAVAATRSLGLPFGGVDLAVENGGVIFEVNVHPMLDVPSGLESVAIPYVRAHLG